MHRRNDLRVGHDRRRAQRVQVALGELAVPAMAGPVGAPDRPHRVALVRRWQLAAVGGGHPGQRHRHVVTQRQVGLAGALMLPATEDFEDQLVALVAVFAQQDVEALEGGRGERLEAVPCEHRPDPPEGAFPELPVAGQEVTGTRWRVELRWHAPMFPDTGPPRHIDSCLGSSLRILTAVPYAHISWPAWNSLVSNRMASTASAPLACAASASRSCASDRVWASILVIPRSSPPTSDLKPAPICAPRWRDRTVRPNTSPRTSVTSYPGRSFMVDKIMAFPFLAAGQARLIPRITGRTLETWYSHPRGAGCSASKPVTARSPSSGSPSGSRRGCGLGRNIPRSRSWCGGRACTPSARKRAAPTSSSAGKTARPRS